LPQLLGRLRAGGQLKSKFEASLGKRERPCLKKVRAGWGHSSRGRVLDYQAMRPWIQSQYHKINNKYQTVLEIQR
jgi:hypothetical protein